MSDNVTFACNPDIIDSVVSWREEGTQRGWASLLKIIKDFLEWAEPLFIDHEFLTLHLPRKGNGKVHSLQ